MDHCDWCNLSEEDKQFQVYESKSWSVFLSDEQDYPGEVIKLKSFEVQGVARHVIKAL